MKRVCGTVMALGMLIGLAACSEREQSRDASASKIDGLPWQGAKNGFIAPGYEPGDKLRWEAQMRRRALDQNEYVKAN